MCGIVGYIGKKNPQEEVIEGLKKLEYRGYDSAGLSYHEANSIEVLKSTGEVKYLEKKISGLSTNSKIAIGHTRWATHGAVTEENAHPHISNGGMCSLVHNGIVENYQYIKDKLINEGYIFHTQTDTEVIANLLEYNIKNNSYNILTAISETLNDIEGANAFVLILENETDKIFAARKGSPLVVGIQDGECIIASDTIPISKYTNEVIYMPDHSISILESNKLNIYNHPNLEPIDINHESINTTIEDTELGDFDTFMAKEISQQPEVLSCFINEYIDTSSLLIDLKLPSTITQRLNPDSRIIILACGSSYIAGLLGKYLIENLGSVPCIIETASEFKYRNPIIKKDDIVLMISQSGETADTISVLELATKSKAYTISICNVEGSTLSRKSDAVLHTKCGPEIGVVSTKTFTNQIAALYILALYLNQQKDKALSKEKIKALLDIPDKLKYIISQEEKIMAIAEEIRDSNSIFFLGRNINYPIAMEGSLKLKEISYIHAEAYPSGELKHGPLAMIDPNFYSIIICPKDDMYLKNKSNIQEIKSRKGKVIGIITDDCDDLKDILDSYIIMPNIDNLFYPFLSTVILQILSYYTAKLKGNNVDKPRNLAKSVTVE